MALWPFPLLNWLTVTIFSIGLYIAYLVIYRLLVSPISKFPGPKLAALTFWYVLYSRGRCLKQAIDPEPIQV